MAATRRHEAGAGRLAVGLLGLLSLLSLLAPTLVAAQAAEGGRGSEAPQITEQPGADSADGPEVALDGCAPGWFDVSRFSLNLRAELSGLGVHRAIGAVVVTFESCEGDVAVVRVAALQEDDGPAEEHEFALDDMAVGARSRGLALALASALAEPAREEGGINAAPGAGGPVVGLGAGGIGVEGQAVDTLSMEDALELAVPTPAQPEGPSRARPRESAATDAARPEPSARAPHLALSAFALVSLANVETLLAGGGAQLTAGEGVLAPFFVRGGIALRAGGASDRLGNLSALVVEGELAAGAEAHWGAFFAGGGAALSVGYAGGTGTPSDSTVPVRSSDGPVVGARAFGFGALQIIGPLSVRAELGLGAVLHGYEAVSDAGAAVMYRGVLLDARLALGVRIF